jgi:hypothetical protein
MAALGVESDENWVRVATADGLHTSILWSEIFDIVSFCDAHGTPVFLHNFEEESNVVEELIQTHTLAEERLQAEIIAWQRVYYDITHNNTTRFSDADIAFEFNRTNRLDQDYIDELLKNELDILCAA